MSKLDFEQIIKAVYDEPNNALRITDGGTGGGSYPEVNTFANLPSAAAFPGAVYLVLNATGIWPFTRRQSGLYFSNGSSWSLLNALTPSDIATMYESNPDVNRYSNSEKAIVASAIQDTVNIGSGTGVYGGKVGTNIQLKTLVAGANIGITNDSSTVTISAIGSSENFSYNRILAGTSKIVPVNQQMVVYQELEIEPTAELEIQGEVVLIE